VDAAKNADCLLKDAREKYRPVDYDNNGTATCDIGAFELEAP